MVFENCIWTKIPYSSDNSWPKLYENVSCTSLYDYSLHTKIENSPFFPSLRHFFYTSGGVRGREDYYNIDHVSFKGSTTKFPMSNCFHNNYTNKHNFPSL